jgi:FlaA1/EpsC-like NDP-sugar epimerase
MKKILITGGSGTVGTAFIEKYYNKYKFYNISRNEANLAKLTQHGYTKRMMEKMFMEHHNNKTKFICTRFANVANSNGSVIPFWKNLLAQNLPLKLTDPKMNRLIFSKEASAELIHNACVYAEKFKSSFILSNIMKTVNMLDLAKLMSDKDPIIVGLRPGEKLNETLVSQKEVLNTKVENNLIFIFDKSQDPNFNIKNEHSSLTANKMPQTELKKLIQ